MSSSFIRSTNLYSIALSDRRGGGGGGGGGVSPAGGLTALRLRGVPLFERGTVPVRSRLPRGTPACFAACRKKVRHLRDTSSRAPVTLNALANMMGVSSIRFSLNT